MPLYDYVCSHCGNVFEASNSVDNRAATECTKCWYIADMVILKAPRLDASMGLSNDFPSAAAKWRKDAERRGRGEDMSSANREVADEGILRDAHAQRAVLGKNKVTVG